MRKLATVSGRKSRRKGAAGEREAAMALTEATGKEWRRGLGQARKGGAEIPDLICEEALLYTWKSSEARGPVCGLLASRRRQTVQSLGGLLWCWRERIATPGLCCVT